MEVPVMRHIPSFVRREGKMTKLKKTALETLWPVFGLSSSVPGLLELDALFGRTSEKTLEIGFGDGHSLWKMAKQSPNQDFIGVEVYRTGVASLLALIAKDPLTNIRIFCADAIEVLERKIPDESLSGIQIFFSDPWPKQKHHKRRLVQPSFVHLVAKKLKLGGTLHLATDWEDYAKQMMWVISPLDCFQNLAGEGQFIPRPANRPLTKYEQRGLKLGHKTWELIFKRIV